MSILTILNYVSKVNIILFILVSLFLGYEIYLFRKEAKRKPLTKLPPLKHDLRSSIFGGAKNVSKTRKKNSKRLPFLVIFSLILFIGIIALIITLKTTLIETLLLFMVFSAVLLTLFLTIL